MSWVRRVASVVAVVAAAVLLGGCVGRIAEPQLEPKLSPPVIVRPGVLRVVVDPSYPPFGGMSGQAKVGLDVDVAAAIADKLGLKLDVIDVTLDQGMALINENKADLLMGGFTVDSSLASGIAFAGTYVSDAPAVFSTRTATVSLDDLGTKRVAAQRGSAAYWLLAQAYGENSIVGMSTLREALSAAASGTVDYAAGDAIVGSYIIRDMPSMHFCGQIGDAFPLGIGVSSDKPLLESDIRSALDSLAAEGVLATLRRKWVGDLPQLQMPSIGASASAVPTSAP